MSNGLYYTLYFVGAFITFLSMILVLPLLGDYKIKINDRNILIFILTITINVLLDIYNVVIIKNLIMVISFIFLIYSTSNLGFKNSVTLYIRELLIIIIGEIIIGLINITILNINEFYSLQFIFLRYFGSLLVILLSVLYYLIIRKKNFSSINNYVTWIFIAYILCIMIIVGTLNFISSSNKGVVEYVLSLLLILIVFLGMIHVFQLFISNKRKNIEIINLKTKNKEVINYIDDFKSYRHNLRYALLAIKENGNKKVNVQIDKLLNKNNDELNYINNFKEIPSSLVHIFSDRLTIGNIKNINVIISNSLSDKELVIKEKYYLDLYEIIGNCLTNAIEAIPKDNPYIYINFYEIGQRQFISIVNNYENDIDIEKIGNIRYSTKQRNSGFGLYSIFHNSSIKVEGHIINNLFKVEILIPL